MKNTIFTVFIKEIRRFFKDRRILFSTILLPGLMIYLIYTFMGSAIQNQFLPEETYRPTVKIVQCPQELQPMFQAFEIVDVSEQQIESVKEEIEQATTDLLVIFPENFITQVAQYSTASGEKAPNIEVFYNSTETHSQAAYTAFTEILNQYESAMTNKFDINANADGQTYDLASEKDLTATIFSTMLPMLLMIFMFSGCLAVAPESIAGEKERGTIATMLVTPVKRSHIAIGKILALSVIALLSGISSTTGTILSLPKLMQFDSLNVDGSFYGATEYLMLGFVVLSSVLFLVALVAIVSAFAKTTKEAQTYVSPLMIIAVLISVMGMFGGFALDNPFIYLIPIYNSVQCMTAIFSFEITTSALVITVISNFIYTGVCTAILAQMFKSERIMFSK